MLNLRLYRTSWLVAGVAVIVALLTLRAPDVPTQAQTPAGYDGAAAAALWKELVGLAPARAAGSADDLRAADWVQQQLAAIPGAASRVRRQEFVANGGGRSYRLANVYLALLPPRSPQAGASRRRGVLVVAPRDTPPGIRGGASGTATLVQLARLAASLGERHRPLLFVSSDGSTVGNAGVRWFLGRFHAFPLQAAVVLDSPGERADDRVWLWSWGRSPRQAVDMRLLAGGAVTAAAGQAVSGPSLGVQLVRLAVPQTVGDQAPAIDAGLPAVTLSGRADAPLDAGSAALVPTADRMSLVGNAAEALLATLDGIDHVRAPAAEVVIGGKALGPLMTRAVLGLLCLPILVAAVDLVARARRQRMRLGRAALDLVRRAMPPLLAFVVAHVFGLTGLLPQSAAGAPPLPADVGVSGTRLLALAIAAGVGAAAWRAWRRAPEPGVTVGAEAAAAAGALAVLLVAAWVLAPFSLVMALPLAHGALVALAARRVWQLLALALAASVPLLALAAVLAGAVNGNPLFALWYLVLTTIDGSRGLTGPVFTVLLASVVWTLGVLVALRVRSGLVAMGPPVATESPRHER